MTKIVFPSDIKYKILERGNKHEPKPVVLRTPADYPVYKVRKVGTFTPTRYSFVITMDSTNRRKFYDFVAKTLKGVKPFEWHDPYDKNTKIAVRFVDEPNSKLSNPTTYQIPVVVETVITAEI